MDDFAVQMIATVQEEDASSQDQQDEPQPRSQPPSSPQSQRTGGGLRGGFAAFRERASMQDRLVEKLLQQVIPADNEPGFDFEPTFSQRPNFNITAMSNNFRRFNARIGVVFKFQARMARVLSWRKPSHTMSLLAVYTFVCLDPYLLSVLPIAILIFGVLIPAFLARHPAPPKGTLSSEQSVGYSPSGPPLAPAATVKPAKELSKDFFRNMRDLQNSMDDFTRAHDRVVNLLVPMTNFSDEALSSTVFMFLSVAGVCMTIAAHLLPWRFVFLVGGWAGIVTGHPSVARVLAATHKQHLQHREEDAKTWLDHWTATDVILDSAPEAREVEVFELQRRVSGDAGEWEPWMFTPSPYDPLSQIRLAGQRPRGTRFFEDVLPPDGWEWSEKKWALDLWSREWVEERIITGVEVETEGERWVYDIYDEAEELAQVGVVDAAQRAKPRAPTQPTWEEGDDGNERRGEWRRRRWVRLVKRRISTESGM